MKAELLTVGLVIAWAPLSMAEQKTPDRFRADANVVMINATVLDRHDRPVRGLTREHFRVYDEKAEQRIAHFSEEETPLSLAVVFDISGSMAGKLAGMRAALDAVLENANPEDEFSLVTFADRPTIAAGWSTNPEEIQNRLWQAPAHGATSLLDALEKALAYMKKAKNARQAMVIFSDGGDNYSRSSEGELLRSLAEAGVQIYAIDGAGVGAPILPRSPEEFSGPDLLERLCDHAGGRYFQVDGKREFAAAAQQISLELRSQYLIEYVPSGSAKDSRFHHVRLQLKPGEGIPKVSVFSRQGYRAPSE